MATEAKGKKNRAPRREKKTLRVSSSCLPLIAEGGEGVLHWF